MNLLNKFLAVCVIFIAISAIIILSISTLTYVFYAPTIVNKQALINHNDQGLTLLDSKGKEFFSFYSANNEEYVPLSSISDYVKKGVVAVEDDSFYRHHGYSIRGIVRSFLANSSSGSITSGGSTITQQLVKNTLLTPDRSYIRKLREIVLAVEIEQYYTKEQILEMYLNTSYFGNNSFGIENASKNYFNKRASKLTLSEASYLIALLPAPTSLSEDITLAKKRQKLVLARMKKLEIINNTEELNALNTKLEFNQIDSVTNSVAPHFALFVRDKLIDKFGERKVIRSGFRVKTTLDTDLQKKAETMVADHIAKIEYQGAGNGSAVVMDVRTGHILSMVGSRGWKDEKVGKMNMAISPRQPGSSFKPIVYALALSENQITPATTLHDKPTTFKMSDCTTDCEYKPLNYDKKYRGNVSVRRALANSLNVPAVEVMQKVGIGSVLEKAPQLGIKSLGNDTSKYGLSLVLGSGEVSLLSMTNAYATFASGGKAVNPVYITEVKDKSGYKQDISDGPSLQNPWTEQVAFLISSILSDNASRREVFGSALTISRPAAVKTGTSESYKDAWTIGYTPDFVVGVWVGNNNMRPMNNIAGSLGAAPIWRQIMEHLNKGLAIKNFDPPEGIVRISACSDESATESAELRQEYFIGGTEPRRNCYIPSRNIAVATESAEITPTGIVNNESENEQAEKNDDQRLIQSIEQSNMRYVVRGKIKRPSKEN